MTWTSLVQNPEGITSVYQGSPPELLDVHVHEVCLHRDGPALRVRLDLPSYPENPPRKWAAQGFNTVQIEVTFSGLREVKLNGFSTNMTATISIEEDTGVQIHLSAPGSDVRAVANTAIISKVTAYLNTPE
ncbi:Imm50 family immunity protein [Streptomyces sp. NBC_00986]|uniref:Imm50 family immunity protein n=1 Tax=Streptomyces sp. NBC_00986 TaxID=2903702 RepID=UPI003870C046|nr:immunity 50 family protein [Streptomyces sp. NBC_00986]